MLLVMARWAIEAWARCFMWYQSRLVNTKNHLAECLITCKSKKNSLKFCSLYCKINTFYQHSTPKFYRQNRQELVSFKYETPI